MHSLLVRLVLAFGLTQALWLMALPPLYLQAGGTVTNCTDDSQFSSLLVGGGTVAFNCGTAPINLSSTKIIIVNTTIDGGGQVTLSGQNAGQLFVVSPGVSLTLRNIVLEKGSSSGNGGAIYNGDNGGDGGVLDLENCTIRDSVASFSGGAIVSTGPLTITNSRLEGNKALNGGALYPRFAGAVTKIVNSVLRNNHATDTTNGWGGAILAWDGAPLTIEGSDLFSNSAQLGGGISIFPNSSVTLNGSTLHDNTAVIAGGGVYNRTGTATLTNVTLSGNSAISGGGVYNVQNGTATLTNVTLSGNSATFSGGGVNNFTGTATLTNVTLNGNSASIGGGGLHNQFSSSTLTNVTLSGNSATFSGGGVNNITGTATLTNVTLSGNSASVGGGIYHFGSASAQILALKNSIVANSPAGGNCFQDLTSVTNITSGGFNLSNDNSCASYFFQPSDQNNKPAQLGPLANNGGFTLTDLPLPPIAGGTGPIDNGSCPVGSFDQRGVSRPQGSACDIGSVEYRQGELTPWLYLPLVEK